MRSILAALVLVLALPCAADEVQTLPKKLLGYWGVSEKGVFNSLLKDAKKRGKVSEKQLAEMKKQAKKFSLMMVKHYAADGKATMYTISGEEVGSYDVMAVRPKKSEMDIEFKTARFGIEKGTVFIGEDFYAHVVRGIPRRDPFVHNLYTFVRITEDEAKKRIKDIEAMKKAREAKPSGK